MKTLLSQKEESSRARMELRGTPDFFILDHTPVVGVPAEDQLTYQSQLHGAFDFFVSGLPVGHYWLLLGAAELMDDSLNRRQINVEVNGQVMIDRLDLVKEFGYATRGEVVREVATDTGELLIRFFVTHHWPMMSVLELRDERGHVWVRERARDYRPKGYRSPGGNMSISADLGLPKFAKLDPEQAFSEFKLSSDGSHYRMAVEDWNGAKQRAASPQWSQWLENQTEAIDDWIAHRCDHVEWTAGWYHDLVSPIDGSLLEWTADEPIESMRSRSGYEIPLTPRLHAAWVGEFRKKHIEMILEAARFYRLTEDERYAKWACGQLDFYATNYRKLPICYRFVMARLGVQSLDECQHLIALVQAARLLEGVAQKDQKEKWSTDLFRPMAELLECGYQSIHNIACWHRSAMGLAALYMGDGELLEEVLNGRFGIRRQLEIGLTGDYIWFEQSLGYGSYVVNALFPFFEEMSRLGRLDQIRSDLAVLENAVISPLLLRFSNGQLPCPADDRGMKFVPDEGLLARIYRVIPSPLSLEAASRQQNWSILLDPPASPRRPALLPEVSNCNRECSRMAVLRRENWQIYFHYGQIHQSHSQAEALNFEAFHGSTDITHDMGTVSYGSPMHNEYCQTGLAHNVPLWGRKGQRRWDPGHLIGFGPDHISAEHENYLPGVCICRSLRIVSGIFIDEVTIRSSTGADYIGLSLHLSGAIELPKDFQDGYPESMKILPRGFAYWTNVRFAQVGARMSFPVRFGEKQIEVELSTNHPRMTVVHASVPDVPPGRRTGLYCEVFGQQAKFTTCYRLI